MEFDEWTKHSGMIREVFLSRPFDKCKVSLYLLGASERDNIWKLKVGKFHF